MTYILKSNQIFKDPHPQLAENISRYPYFRSIDLLNSTSLILESSITNVSTTKANSEAVKFNKKLVEVLKGETKTYEAREHFYTSI